MDQNLFFGIVGVAVLFTAIFGGTYVYNNWESIILQNARTGKRLFKDYGVKKSSEEIVWNADRVRHPIWRKNALEYLQKYKHTGPFREQILKELGLHEANF